MSNFLIAVAVFIITVLAALFAVPYVIDWNGYRGVFEEEASRMLGREVRVGGAVNLHFLPTPYVSLERVRIADATGGLQEPFFRTESLTIKLAVPPLLRGAVEANEIELRRPVLRLAVDDKGHWNWQQFASAFTNAAYVPTNVALSSVVVKDGVLALHGPDGQERTSFEHIEADLSSPALEGPYRLRASFGNKGAERELRLATSKPETDGSVRLKASLRAIDTSSTYTLDARVQDLMSAMSLDGELTARLPFGGLWPTQTRAVTDEAFDLKANVKADAERLQLAGLTLSFEQDGTPQIITGDLQARWRKALEVEAKLSARWLDLDRIAGATSTSGPLDSILPFAQRIRDLLPSDGRSRASLSVEQANVGRDTVGGLELALTRSGNLLEIENFRSAMPGGSRLDLKGTLAGTADNPAFTGSLNVRGTSLARFTSWASGGALSSEGKADGSFGLRGQLAIDAGRFALRDLAAEISGTILRGAASYQWGEASEIGLRIEGPQLDARAFIPAGADLGDLVAILGSRNAQEPGRLGASLAKADLAVRINTGKLITAGAAYRDVTVEIERKAGSVRIPRLRMSGDEGFVLDLEGEVVETAGRPKGTLRLFANADTPPALKPLAELAGIPASLRPDGTRFQALAPLRLAGTVTFGQRTPTSLDIIAEGEANGGALQVAGRFDGSDSGWRSSPTELTVSITNPVAANLAALLLPATGSVTTDAAAKPDARPGRVLLRAGGVPAEGMSTLFSLTANDTGVAFSGRFTASKESPRLVGDVELANADASRIAALARLVPPLRLGTFPLSGTLRLATDGSTINVDRFALDVGGVLLRGQLGIAPEDNRQRLNARIEADELSVAHLLAPLLDGRLGSATAVAEAALSERPSIWPPQPFDAGVLDGLVGDIAVDVKRLAVYGSVVLNEARLLASIGDGKVVVRQIAGTGLKGSWALALALARTQSGAELSGTLQADALELATLSPAADGVASAKLAFQGRGVSPRALMASLQGNVSITLQKASIPVSPAAISKAIDRSMAAGSDRLPQVLRQGLAANLAQTPLPLPDSIELTIADGILRSKPLSVEIKEGSAAGATSLDLSPLNLTSDWRLTDKTLSVGGRGLPPIAVQYSGPLAALGRMDPQINAEALEREVTVRKMERDVDELERLRRLDETRRREDAERLREQIERGQTAQPPVKVEAPPPQPAPPPRPQVQPKAQPKSFLPTWLQ